MSKLNHLALSLACLTTACGSDQTAEAEANSQGSTTAGVQHTAGLVPDLSPSEGRAETAGERGDELMAISSLVPEGSFAWVRVSSFDDLGDLMNEFMGAFSGPDSLDFETALTFVPVQGVFENIDRSRELGLAIGFSQGSSEPAVTMILPVLDRGAVIQGLRTLPEPPQCFGIDDYVVATNLDEYRPGLGSALLTEGLPEGQIAARVDAQAVMSELGPMFAMGLQQMAQSPAPGFEDVRESIVQALTVAGESADSVDLAINLEGGEVDFSLAFVAAPDSELDGILPRSSGSLHDLARCLEGTDTLSMMLTIDSETTQDLVMPLYTQALDSAVADGELDAAVQALMIEWGHLWPLFGDSVVASVNADADSFCATYYFQPPDPDSFVKSFEAVLESLGRSTPSLQVVGPVKGSVETSYHLSFQGPASEETRAALAALFPSGKLTLRIAERRDITVITVGGDERSVSQALDRVARSDGELPAHLAYAMDRVGDANPAFLARIDMVGLIRDLAGKLEGQPGAEALAEHGIDADEEPLYLTYYGGVDGRVWRLGFRADVSHFGALVK